ncbi:MAG: PKD domain-containing protein [Chitinophagales bacterium]
MRTSTWALLLFCFTTFLSATTFAQQFTTEGKEFWFGFMQNTLGSPPDTLMVSMSSRFNASATVSIPLSGWSQSVTIPANTSVTVGIPKATAMASGCGAMLPMGCHIQSDQQISAYALNFQGYSADATLLIPNPTLGDKYYLNTYRENYSNSRQTQMLIVAAYPNTTIQITPSVATACGNPAGVPFQINLNQGQVYNLESNDDLTGTFVQSIDVGQGCKKFVLFSGNFCTAVGSQCCCDHLYDINFYNDSWGKNYILPNLRTRGQTRFRVVSQQNGTQVSVNGGPVQNINAGQYYQFDLSANGSLTSNNPVSVLQLSMSGDVDGSSADPFMILLGPNEQTLNEITFNTLFNSGNSPNYYATIVTKSNSTGLITLDGAPITGFVPVASNPAYSIASPTVAYGSHTIKSDSGFLAYIYEYASYESFGYSAGANLSNLFANFEYASSRFDSIFCPGDTVFFQGIGDPSILSYEWDFGDGDTARTQNPHHVYTALGDFTVKMIIQRQNSCDKDTIPGNIKILGPPITDVPDDSICIGSSITVAVTSTDSIRWSTGDTAKSITLSPTVTTSYSVYAKNVACAGMPDTFTIKVRDPKVDFTTSPKCFGNPIRFTPSASTSLQYFSWDFGDGNVNSYTSAILNYTDHTYASAGTFQVTLAVIDSFGCKDTVRQNVSVFPLLNQDFTVNDVCFNGTANVINNTTVVSGSIQNQWIWGDGSTNDTAFSPTHVYTTVDTFTITYIAVTDSGCSDTLTKQIIVYDTASVDFTATDTCLGNSTVFNVSSSAPPGSTPFWDFGDGIQSSDTFPIHTYAAPGVYTVTSIIITPQGCNDTLAQQVEVFPKPLPDFVADSTCDGDSLTFTNLSSIASGTYTNMWDLGDGNTSTDISPTHLYAAYGNYTVKLVLTSDKNCLDSITKVATVNPNPTAAFTINDVCNDSTLTASNTSSVPSGTLSYNWNWGDGDTSSIVPASHNYSSSGTYTVSVTVTTNKGCVDTASQTATVILGSVMDFSIPEVCETAPSIFTDLSVLKTGTTVASYAWDFGDGNTAATQNTSHTYATYGNYNVKLVLDYGNSCFDSITKVATVHQNPTAAFTSTTVCENNYTNFTNNSSPAGLAYTWNFGDGNTSTNDNPTHLYAGDGIYPVVLVATSTAQCSDTITDSVTVLTVGEALFSVAPTCLGNASLFVNQTDTVLYPTANFTWFFGDGSTSNQSTPQKQYTNTGNFNITMIANFANSCADTAYGSTSVFEIPAFTAQTKNVSCFSQNDGEITIQATAGKAPFNYTWVPALSNSAIQTNVFAGKYVVTFSDANSCSDTLSVTITQPDSLSLYIAVDSISCFGRSDGKLRAFATGGTPQYSYVWSNGVHQHENANLKEGDYTVTVSDANLCELIRTVLLPNPVKFAVNLVAEDTIQLGEDITLTPTYNYSNITHWQWTPATALNCIDCENPIANPYNDIVYTVYATTEKGCIDSAYTRINVEHNPVVYVPNLFTPNSDGLNDIAMVYANNVMDLEFLIFNRWGEKVYEGHHINEGWNGFYQNKLQEPETYVYVVTVTFLNNKKVTKTGSITLVK